MDRGWLSHELPLCRAVGVIADAGFRGRLLGRSMKECLKKIAKSGAVAVVAALLTACGYQDAPKPVEFKPGVYQGKTDEALSKEQVERLRERGATAY